MMWMSTCAVFEGNDAGMPSLFCFDTNILIFVMKALDGSMPSDPGQAELVARAGELIRRLDKDNDRVMLPALVVSEYLLGEAPERHPHVIRSFQASFVIEPFDIQCARIFSQLWHADGRGRSLEKGTLPPNMTRNDFRAELRADFIITATAVAKKATALYTNDPHCESFSNGAVPCRPLPELSAQQHSLF